MIQRTYLTLFDKYYIIDKIKKVNREKIHKSLDFTSVEWKQTDSPVKKNVSA